MSPSCFVARPLPLSTELIPYVCLVRERERERESARVIECAWRCHRAALSHIIIMVMTFMIYDYYGNIIIPQKMCYQDYLSSCGASAPRLRLFHARNPDPLVFLYVSMSVFTRGPDGPQLRALAPGPCGACGAGWLLSLALVRPCGQALQPLARAVLLGIPLSDLPKSPRSVACHRGIGIIT